MKVMKTKNAETLRDLSERDFNEFTQKGDDFFKIELLRPARIWYNKALSLKQDNERVKNQIAECDRMLAYETKIVRILILIASVLIAGILILK